MLNISESIIEIQNVVSIYKGAVGIIFEEECDNWHISELSKEEVQLIINKLQEMIK